MERTEMKAFYLDQFAKTKLGHTTFKNLPKLSNDGKINFNVASLVFLE